ncbi:AAA family ATPase, partial [Oleiphilus sp. HI0080]
MSKAFFLSPTNVQSGLTSITYGLVYALERIGVRVGVFQPIDYQLSHPDNSRDFAKMLNKVTPAQTISLPEAQTLMSENKSGLLMERVIANFQIAS